MKTTLKNTLILLAASTLITTACKTTDHNQNTYDQPLTEQKPAQQNTATTGELHQKQVSALTPEERNIFNESIQQIMNATIYTDDMIRGTCNMNAAFMTGFSIDGTLSETELQTACAEARNECITDMNAHRETNAVAEMEIPADCSVTVAEFEACAHGMAQNYKNIVSKYIECESHDLESFQSAGTEYPLASLADPLPTACQLVYEKCPTAF